MSSAVPNPGDPFAEQRLSPRSCIEPRCVVCGARCGPLHTDAGDYFFGSPIATSYVVCEAMDCRTVAQDPAPDPATIASYYTSYYTHAVLGGLKKLKKRYEALRLRVAVSRAVRSGVPCDGPAPDALLRANRYVLDAGGMIPGRTWTVLDVGCGNGDGLVALSGVGFGTVKGVELDASAVAAASKLGFEVRQGSAESIPFESGTFDFVSLHHVIEHAADPRAAIVECARVLRPGGYLSLVTPNAVSSMHEKHGKFWRGLEAPRHLHLFTVPSLSRLVADAGLVLARQGTSDRSATWMDEVSARVRGPQDAGRFVPIDASLARGEEVYVIARKPS